jgi:hypothetical protein
LVEASWEKIMMSIGIMEIVIILVIGGGALLGLVGVCVAIVLASRGKSAGSWTPPKTAGLPKSIRLLGPSDSPVAESASWDGTQLVVKSDEAGSKSLFDVPLKNLEHCVITYRFKIKTDALPSAVYPEMWCRIPEKGQFFSRGLDRKVRGSNDWKEVEIPFYLQQGQQADLLHLNLAFEGRGTVRLKDIEVLASEVAVG